MELLREEWGEVRKEGDQEVDIEDEVLCCEIR